MALGFMRHHRRWLYVFLWMVIPAMIILYLPAFIPQEDAAPATPGSLAEVGGQPITVGEYQRAYLRQRAATGAAVPGPPGPGRCWSGSASRSRPCSPWWSRADRALEAQRLGLCVDDETLAREMAALPALPGERPLPGRGRDRRRLDLQGITEQEFESMRGDAARAAPGAVTDGVSVTPAEVEREFRRRNEQVKAEYVLVPADSPAAPPSTTRCRPLRGGPEATAPREARVSYLLVDARLASSASRTEAERAYYREHATSSRTPEEACASHILVKVKATPRRGAPGRRGAPHGPGGPRPGEGGARTSRRWRRSLRGQGLGAAGGRPRLLRPRAHGARVRQRRVLLEPARCPSWCARASAIHVIRLTRRKEESVPPSRR